MPNQIGFWDNVEEVGPCWEWQGRILPNGYGQFKREGAHRVAYRLLVGEIPDGLYVLHSCDNRKCVNPHHLRVGTQSENMLEAAERKRTKNSAKTHCHRGHALDGYNLIVGRQGNRHCRECGRIRNQAFKARKRASGACPIK